MSAILRLAKLKSAAQLRAAAGHNLRQIAKELGHGLHIDAGRVSHNITLHGASDASGIVNAATARMIAAGVDPKRLRKDAVRCVEVVISLADGIALDIRAFFTACTTWAGERFGGAENLISSIVHLDEAQPHCHILIVPIVGGRMNGGKLCGDRKKLAETTREFFSKVCAPFGLKSAPATLQKAQKRLLSRGVIERLDSDGDSALCSQVWQPIRDAIEREPLPFAQILGIELSHAPVSKPKTLAEIFTGTGKRTSEDTAKSIDFGRKKTGQSLPCVDFAPFRTLSAPPIAPHRTRNSVLAETLS